MKKDIKKTNKMGYALIYAVMFIALVMITAFSLSVMALTEVRQTRHAEVSTNAYQLAMGGLEWGMGEVARKDTFNINDARCENVAGGTNKDLGYYCFKGGNTGSEYSIDATGYFPEGQYALGKKKFSVVTLTAKKDLSGGNYQIWQKEGIVQ